MAWNSAVAAQILDPKENVLFISAPFRFLMLFSNA